jgi:ActR/RegA family two-component response regulator
MTASETVILVADGTEAEAIQTAAAVELLGFRVRIAASTRATLDVLRNDVVSAAFVGVELTLGGELLLRRVSALPSIRWLVAIGPGFRADLEHAARCGGADVYLSRPVSPEQVAWSLGASGCFSQEARAP